MDTLTDKGQQMQNIWPLEQAKITFSEDVASLVPCRLRAIQLSGASWAAISVGDFSVLARSTTWTCPVLRPGNVSMELLLFGHITQRPEK